MIIFALDAIFHNGMYNNREISIIIYHENCCLIYCTFTLFSFFFFLKKKWIYIYLMPYIKITVCKKKKDRGEIQCSILSSLRVKRKG